MRPLRLSLVPFLAASLALGAPGPLYAAAPQKNGPDGGIFLLFDPFTVSVIERQQMKGLLVLEIALQIASPDKRRQAEEIQPRLRDGFVRTLMAFGATRARADRPPDLTRIANVLQDETDNLLGSGAAHVLITQALLRPMN